MKIQNNEITPTMINISHQDEDDHEVNINLWLAILNEAKWRIMFIALLGAFVSFFMSYVSMPRFEVDAMLYASSEPSAVPGLEGIPGLGSDSSPALTEAQILLTKQTLGEVVRKLNLNYYAKPHFFPFIGEGFARHFNGEGGNLAEPLFWFNSYAWGGERIHIEQFDVPEKWKNVPLKLLVLDQGRYHLLDRSENILLESRVGELSSKDDFTLLVSDLHARVGTYFDIMHMSELQAIEKWREKLSAAEDVRGSNILKIRCATVEPKSSVMVMNQLLQIHIQNNIEFSAAQSEKGIQFIMQQLPELREKLEAAQYELNEYLRSHETVNVALESSSLLNEIMDQERKISDLEVQRLELLNMFTPKSNKVQVIDGKLKYMKNEKIKMQQSVKKMPKKTQTVSALERNVQIASDLYISLLNRMQALRIAKASDSGNLRIVDMAMVPERPTSLGMGIMIVLGFIAGLLLGLTGVLWGKLVNDGIENPDDIEKLGLTVLANIPHSVQQEKIHLDLQTKSQLPVNQRFLVSQEGDDLAVESLRSLRTNLYFSLSDSDSSVDKKRIMISSSGPEAGKSFISANLAQLFQHSGKKVLIIDADMRRGYMRNYYNIPGTMGLSDVLSGKADIHKAIHHSTESLADILTTGTRPTNPAELLMQPNFAELLDQLDLLYDLIIIDTPPVLAVTDAIIIGALVHESIVVLKSGQQNAREIKQMIERFSKAGIHLLGAVFNDIPANAMSGVGTYGYGYHYQYQYGSPSKL